MYTIQLKSILPTWRAAHQKQLCYCPSHFADCQHDWQTDHKSATCGTFTDADAIYIMQNFHSDSIYTHTSTSAVPPPSQSIRMPLFWTLFFPTGPWRHQIAICRKSKSNRPVLYMYKLAKLKPRLENVHIDIRRQDDEIHYKINEPSGTETRQGISKPHPRLKGPPHETDNF